MLLDTARRTDSNWPSGNKPRLAAAKAAQSDVGKASEHHQC